MVALPEASSDLKAVDSAAVSTANEKKQENIAVSKDVAPAIDADAGKAKPEPEAAAKPVENVTQPPPDAAIPALNLDGASSSKPASTTTGTTKGKTAPSSLPSLDISDDGLKDFQGAVDSNNDLPTAETLREVEDYIVLNKDGRTCTFRSLYTGRHVARRVLVIFVRHFFCGMCQDYLRALSASITPDALLQLTVSTFIVVIGCGDPKLIDMYAEATGCPFPIYSDPTRRLYAKLGMVRNLALGERPAYATRSVLKASVESIAQGLKQLRTGLATKSGDYAQVGGEFLFEPYSLHTPLVTPWRETPPELGKPAAGGADGAGTTTAGDAQESQKSPAASTNKPTNTDLLNSPGEDIETKRVTWCHRMKTTRDHAEIPELMEVLGLDGHGKPIEDKKRWDKALGQRKGTGLSMAAEMAAITRASEDASTSAVASS